MKEIGARRAPLTEKLLHNFERGPLAMPRGRTSEQRANRVNGLAITANDAADVALSYLQLEDRSFSAGNFREHHFIGIFDQLSNDELEEFFHVASGVDADVSGGATGAGSGSAGAGVAAAGVGAGTPGFLFFLSKLRTVSDGWAPRAIQYSARSTFNVLLCPGFLGSYVPMISINLPSRGLRLSATTTL